MNFKKLKIVLSIVGLCFFRLTYAETAFSENNKEEAKSLPMGFVYLAAIDSSIVQDMRYAGVHNFVGYPLPGYQAPKCILTETAAKALSQIQTELKASRLSLKVFDCYRPTRAVDEFVAWSALIDRQEMKTEFFPNTNKKDFFDLGYVAKKSGHSRGSTVDLTVIPVGSAADSYKKGQALTACTESYQNRFFDGSLDFGTGYDCMDNRSHVDQDLGVVINANRMMLRTLMAKYGFNHYAQEWWHFTLRNEPFPDTYFNFLIK